MMPVFSSRVSSSIPIILDGMGALVSQMINSPTARQPMMIASCLNIIFDSWIVVSNVCPEIMMLYPLLRAD